jgi:phosphatidylserine decarboxylase
MIAPEGKIILVPVILIVVIGTIVNYYYPMTWLKWMNVFFISFTIFSLYFFREPNRILPTGQFDFISPADGKIIDISEREDADLGKVLNISIFMNVFNVHRQWVPFDAKVIDAQYNKGKFFGAYRHKASMDNEQWAVIFETENGIKFKTKQIAGFIARRILNYMEINENASRGDRLGFIRFGSRVDILLPTNFVPNIKLGQKVTGGETVIGELK